MYFEKQKKQNQTLTGWM